MAINKRLIPRASGLTLSEHYNILSWTGDGTGNRNITGLSFQPDQVWMYRYFTNSTYHDRIATWSILGNSSNGYPKHFEFWNADSPKDGSSSKLRSLLSNGIEVGSYFNSSGHTYFAVCWKHGGNSSNPDVNTDFQCSQTTYSGDGTYRNRDHDLGATESVAVHVKSISSSHQWTTRPAGVSATDFCTLTDGYGCYDYYWAWQDTGPSSNTFRVGAVDYVNASGKDYFAWCTAQVAGFSSYGTYTGNGDATTGPTITTGFQPSFVICGTAKEGSNTHPFICTNRHQSSNTGLNVTMADWHGRWMSSNATMDFLSTGFRVNSQYNTYNGNGDSYWYMAWADPDIVG